MTEIKWEIDSGYVYTKIGLVHLLCEPTEFWYNLETCETEPGGKWGSSVRIGLAGPRITGPHRVKLSRCKEDCIALACQLIRDAETIVDEQVRIFRRKGLLM
jgi:hypothetical protein